MQALRLEWQGALWMAVCLVWILGPDLKSSQFKAFMFYLPYLASANFFRPDRSRLAHFNTALTAISAQEQCSSQLQPHNPIALIAGPKKRCRARVGTPRFPPHSLQKANKIIVSNPFTPAITQQNGTKTQSPHPRQRPRLHRQSVLRRLQERLRRPRTSNYTCRGCHCD